MVVNANPYPSYAIRKELRDPTFGVKGASFFVLQRLKLHFRHIARFTVTPNFYVAWIQNPTGPNDAAHSKYAHGFEMDIQ